MKKRGKSVHYTDYTDYIENILKRFDPTHIIMEKKGPLYKSGVFFEKAIQKWCKKVLGFQYLKHEKEELIFNDDGSYFTDDRIIRLNVPFFGLCNKINDDAGYDVEKKHLCNTEICLYAKKFNHTDVFSPDYYDENGNLNVRVEVRTQNVNGTAFEKNTDKIRSLYFGSPEKAIILLITGKYVEPCHFRYARYTADECNSGKSIFGDRGKKIVVMDERDFVRWSIKTYGVRKEQNYSNRRKYA